MATDTTTQDTSRIGAGSTKKGLARPVKTTRRTQAYAPGAESEVYASITFVVAMQIIRRRMELELQ